MNLRTKCEDFLKDLSNMRTLAINEAVQKEIQAKHEPYKAQMISVRDKALANEEQQFNLAVEQLKKEHKAKVESIVTDFDNAINAHKADVEQTATDSVKVEYNNIILKISAIADEIKVN